MGRKKRRSQVLRPKQLGTWEWCLWPPWRVMEIQAHFSHVKFEILTRHPRGNAEYAVGYARLKFRKEVGARNKDWEQPREFGW